MDVKNPCYPTALRARLEFGKIKRGEKRVKLNVERWGYEIGACEKFGEEVEVVVVDDGAEGDGTGRGRVARFAVWGWCAEVSLAVLPSLASAGN
jgi:hypothetical protein